MRRPLNRRLKVSKLTRQKRKLRLSSFTSKLLFDGQVGTIYKENTDENQQLLIRNALTRLNLTRHLLLPESLRLSLVRRSLILRRRLRRTSLFMPLEPLRKDNLLRDLVTRVEVVAPPIEEPLPARNTEVQAPLPLPLPNIPVGGRLAHFAQNWAKITDDKWVL